MINRHKIILSFSRLLRGNENAYLNGSGGNGGDGLPMPLSGVIVSLNCWDGSELFVEQDARKFDKGDRISIYADMYDRKYRLTVRINGGNTESLVIGLATERTLWASILIMLDEDEK